MKNRMNKIGLWLRVAVCGIFAVLCGSTAQAAYTIVTEDGSGNVTFSPGGLVTPILTGAVAAAVAAAGLVLLAVGVRWIYRMIKMSR